MRVLNHSQIKKCLMAVLIMLTVMAFILIPDTQAYALEGTSGSIGDVDYSFNESTGKLTITVTTGHENYEEIVISKPYS